MSAKFVHGALQSPGAEIRLLELLPGIGKEKVQCHLSTFSLSSLPIYQPLSYCWGPQTNLREIFVNDKNFFVTYNLAAALRRLRRPNASCFLWVDAICINQADNFEKSSQIPLMGEIYARGERTVIWLGEHDRKTRRAFAMLETMAEYANTIPKEELVRLHPDRWQILKKTLRKKGPAGTQANHFKPNTYSPAYWIGRIRSGHARTSVFGRPWFTRVWILQEIAMSRHAVILCGKYLTNWDNLEKAYEISELWDQWKDGQYLQTLIEIRASIQAGISDELGSVILKAAHCQATVPADRIYAVLGLAKKLPPGFEIAIDYTADTITKFAEATRVCIASTRNLELVLDGRGRPTDYDGMLPSWSWSLQTDPEQPTYQWQFHRAAATKCLFQAAKRETEESGIYFSNDGRLLFVRGIVFDEVVDVGPIFGDMEIGYVLQAHGTILTISDKRMPPRHLSHMHTSKGIANVVSPEPYPGKHETRRQAWIGFLTGILTMSDGITDECKARDTVRLEEALMKPYHILGRGPGELPWSKKASLRDPQMPRIRIEMLHTDRITGKLMEYLAKRRVVRTSQGYIGLCNRYTKAGDRLALIGGVCVPVVLCPTLGGRWRIVGESYVYGIMHGELWSSDKAQTLCVE